ncbi:MAG: sigma-54 dependent transcriptional regulator [Desulfohalobiaceae bacterium]|nr:sigma-54 dependent transcriptional regulator [Desulfohalobiaceae bacterium]
MNDSKIKSRQQWQLLLVEDENLARKNLEHILKKEGYICISTDKGTRALELLQSREFDLVLTDLKLKTVDGMQILQKSKSLYPQTEVIMITGYATVDSAVAAMREGAYFYLSKPYQLEEVRTVVREALIKRELTLENRRLKEGLNRSRSPAAIVGKSRLMEEVLKRLRQVAPTESNVLILGESGTGKELVARAIHSLSPRAANQFVAFNCGSFSEELMANELFGHEKSAYTGATSQKKGLLETADQGTVFLDEIGDMPQSMQIKLLRVIQEKELLRVGGVTPLPVDLRFIAATHRDLKKEVDAGRFRQDLYYRLNVISVSLPPLVERAGDIPLLANHFLARKIDELQKDIREIDPQAMELLGAYSWPGNVRELENVIERAVALANREIIKPEFLPEHIRNLSIETYRRHFSKLPTLEEQEIEYIRWILKKCEGNKTKAAQIMGIDRVSLWRKMKRYGLEEDS